MTRDGVLSAAWNIGFGAALSLTTLGAVGRFLGASWHDVGPFYGAGACLWMMLWLWRGFRHD